MATHQISEAKKFEHSTEHRCWIIYFDTVSLRENIRTNSSFFFTVCCHSDSLFGSIFSRMILFGHPFSRIVLSRCFNSLCMVSRTKCSSPWGKSPNDVVFHPQRKQFSNILYTSVFCRKSFSLNPPFDTSKINLERLICGPSLFYGQSYCRMSIYKRFQ